MSQQGSCYSPETILTTRKDKTSSELGAYRFLHVRYLGIRAEVNSTEDPMSMLGILGEYNSRYDTLKGIVTCNLGLCLSSLRSMARTMTSRS